MKSTIILTLITCIVATPVQLDRRLIDLGAKVNVANLLNADVDLGILDKGKLLRLNTDIGVLNGKKDPAYPYPPTGYPYPYPPYPYPYPFPNYPPQQPQQPNYPPPQQPSYPPQQPQNPGQGY